MASESYWRKAAIDTRLMSWRSNCSAEYTKLADFYEGMAETERKRANEQEVSPVSHDLPDDWYEDHDGQRLVLDSKKVADAIKWLRLWAGDEQQKREKAEEQRMEARSEIERLQAEVVKWQIEAGKFGAGCPACDDIGEENERLNARLEQIAIVCTDNMDRYCNHRMALDFVRQIANGRTD